MALDLRQLRYFAAVADFESFTRAAEHLHVAQSALSLHVRRLEETLGVQLLLREPRGVRVTGAGARLLDHAHAILEQLVLAERDLRSHYSTPTGPVSIGIPSGAGRILTAALLNAARDELPGVSLQVSEGMTGHLQEWLQQGRINLAVLYSRAPATEAVEVAREDLFLVSSQPINQGGEVQFSELVSHPLVLPSRRHGTRQCIEAAAKRQGLTLNVELELDSLSSILDVVEQGRGLTILAGSAFERQEKQGNLFAWRIVNPNVVRPVFLITPPQASGDAAVAAVRELIIRLVKQLVDDELWPGISRDAEPIPDALRQA